MSNVFNAKIDVLIVGLMIQNVKNAVSRTQHNKDTKLSAIETTL